MGPPSILAWSIDPGLEFEGNLLRETAQQTFGVSNILSRESGEEFKLIERCSPQSSLVHAVT